MPEHQVDLFYVTCDSEGQNPHRVDVAKFFSRAAAEQHASSLVHFSNVKIDLRTEAWRSQHPAHRPENA